MTRARRQLNSDEAGDAERLKKIWDEKSPGLKLTQFKASKEFGYANQSAISQYINGRIPLNIEAAAKFAKILHVGLDEISPRFSQALTPAPLQDCPIIAAVPSGRVVEADKSVVEAIGECRWYVADDGVKKLSDGVFIVGLGDGKRRVVKVEKQGDTFVIQSAQAKPIILPIEAADLVTVHAQIFYKITKV